MKILIVTGMSGAGKTQTVNALEDLGCFCVDNMPPELIPKFAEICSRAENTEKMVAIVCDIRGGKLFGELTGKLEKLEDFGYEYEILFLEASDEVLLKRYKETRREHPLAIGGRIPDGIQQERKLLSGLRENANHIIDTSLLSTGQLKEMIISAYGETQSYTGMMLHLVSFGFKNGIPMDSDLVFDV
ncbi:MAG: RNase adaptor protein RapZ, partial [Clostridia bacterium]|nr:RNase adaptor protein RapZ [Clostridia bacterium]